MSKYAPCIPHGIAFIDGEYKPLSELSISIVDMGFTQGAATYDVAHVIDGKFFRLDWHIERFRNSAEGLSLVIPYNDHDLIKILCECVKRAKFKNAFVWMGLTQGIPSSGNPRDYHLAQPRFYAYAKEYYDISSEKGFSPKGVHISVSSVVRIPPQSVDPRYKNHHWLDLRRAQIEAKREGFDTTVLIDSEGNISEGPGFNIAAVVGGRIISPDKTVLDGITRRAISVICDELDIPFKLAPLTQVQLRNADEAFLSSTSGGITPVFSVDCQKIANGTTGPLTKLIQDEYWRKHTDLEWTLPV